MISPVSNATHAQPVAQAAPATQQPAPSKPQPAPPDTVQISAAALAVKEAIENPAQTAHEAASGDQVAKRLLAKEAADRVV
jgi:hypothetical protein